MFTFFWGGVLAAPWGALRPSGRPGVMPEGSLKPGEWSTPNMCALASRDIPKRPTGCRAPHGAARTAPQKKVS